MKPNTFVLPSVVMAFLLGACAPAAAPTAVPAVPPTAVAPAKPTAVPNTAANTLVYARAIDDAVTMDPAVAYEFSGVVPVSNAYETLVRYEGTDYANVKPSLATKWEIKDNGDTWGLTFTLRDGAKFASGNPVTADDVVYSFQRVIKLKKSPAFLFTDIGGLKVESFSAVNEKTFGITMPKTASAQAFLAVLTFATGSVVDSKLVKANEKDGDSGTAYLQDKSAGSGPYVIESWTKNVDIRLKANAAYTGNKKPSLNSIIIKHVPENTNQLFMLEKGEADIAGNLSSEQLDSLKGKPGTTQLRADSWTLAYIGMNATVKPLDNVKVRQALRYAVDYDGIVNNLLNGKVSKVQGIIPKGLAGYNDNAPFKQDIEKAKGLLKEAGVENGFSMDMSLPSSAAPGGAQWSDIGAKLQSDFKKIGVTINLKPTLEAELLTAYRAQKLQMMGEDWGPDFADPDANGTPFGNYSAKSLAWRNGWDDKESEKLSKDAALETDPAKRVAKYKVLTEYVMNNGPFIILYQPTEGFGLRDNLKGFAFNPLRVIDFSVMSK